MLFGVSRFILAAIVACVCSALVISKGGPRRVRALNMQQEKIVVTGMGIVSPAGSTVPVFFDNLCNGVSGIGKLDRFDPTSM